VGTTDAAIATPVMLYIEHNEPAGKPPTFHIAGDPAARRHAAAIE
jgi:hypothetical protein